MQNTEPELMRFRKSVHVAVGVIVNADGRILISQRLAKQYLGGFWEFPGGKVEAGEGVREALVRELKEELDIKVSDLQPLIQIHYDYADKSVFLDTWKVGSIEGVPQGNEGQEVKWVEPELLPKYRFPPANIPIIKAVRLPHCYMITGYFDHSDELFEKVDSAISLGIKLIQFRAPWLSVDEYNKLACVLSERARLAQVLFLVKGELSLLKQPWCRGLHLTSKQLYSEKLRSLSTDKWLAASCHNEVDLRNAEQKGLSFVTLSPVAATASHPGVKPLGIEGASMITQKSSVPVYLLGGQQLKDEGVARWSGAQGIAGISAFWH